MELANPWLSIKPLLISLQPSPLLVERNTPSDIPAKICPTLFMASTTANEAGIPLLIGIHCWPLSMLRNIPPFSTPAKICPAWLIARVRISGPLVCCKKLVWARAGNSKYIEEMIQMTSKHIPGRFLIAFILHQLLFAKPFIMSYLQNANLYN